VDFEGKRSRVKPWGVTSNRAVKDKGEGNLPVGAHRAKLQTWKGNHLIKINGREWGERRAVPENSSWDRKRVLGTRKNKDEEGDFRLQGNIEPWDVDHSDRYDHREG